MTILNTSLQPEFRNYICMHAYWLCEDWKAAGAANTRESWMRCARAINEYSELALLQDFHEQRKDMEFLKKLCYLLAEGTEV